MKLGRYKRELSAALAYVVLLLLLLECAIFSLSGNNFLSEGNAFEVTRLSVEIGLLALALTPIIITGGIENYSGSSQQFLLLGRTFHFQ